MELLRDAILAVLNDMEIGSLDAPDYYGDEAAVYYSHGWNAALDAVKLRIFGTNR
jgi:predicted transcriptional regulator